MGCGSSKSTTVTEEKSDNPSIEPISIQDVDTRYPRATPPPNNKVDIYNSADYTSVDARVRQQLTQINTSTYETLISTLTAGFTTELEKLRAIFVWLYLQDIHGSFYSRVTDPYTPRGYMKLIKTQNGSYSSFFAQLCRSAGIPCNVIRGVGKGDKYVVGDQDMSRLESAWNVVFVSGGWRLIHPLWSFFQEKQTYENRLRPPNAEKRAIIHEFFWLIDPVRFINFCKPHSDEWQLLNAKWDDKKFLQIPQFLEEYFNSGLILPKKYNGILRSDAGVFVLDFDHDNYEEPALEAKVEFEAEVPGDSKRKDVNMKDYVATAGSSKTKTLAIRFPVRGWYKVDISGGLDSRKPKIAKMRIECKRAGIDPQKFPINPQHGFGIDPISSQFGISDPVPDNGIVLVRPEQQKLFTFTCSQKLDVHATLLHIMHGSDRFTDCIDAASTNNAIQVSVMVPYDAHLEFVLKIAVRREGHGEYKVVANYLLVDENWQKNVVTVPPSKTYAPQEAEKVVIQQKVKDEPARIELIAATNDESIDRLEKAIGDFKHHGLSDNGDLTRAKDKLIQLHLENLRKATYDRKLEDLENAIDSAHKSHVAPDLEDSTELADAVKTRQQLGRLKLYLHKVLALNKPTIAEMYSYQRPRPLVHQVMKATFRILGEPNNKIQNWAHIQTSMRQLGKNSMLARMKRCDVVNVKQRYVEDAENYLGETNKLAVRMCSAGAGTFYIWSNNLISEYHGKHDNESPSASKNYTSEEEGKTNRKSDNYNTRYPSRQMETPRDQRKAR